MRESAQRLLFRELMGRYHYREHRVPFGAQLRYLVFASWPRRAVVGCFAVFESGVTQRSLPALVARLAGDRGDGDESVPRRQHPVRGRQVRQVGVPPRGAVRALS